MTRLRANLSLLPVLHVLLTECSVSRAAERLGLTQSAVSQALARARAVWNDDLLIRHGQRMFATPLAVDLAVRIDVWMSATEALMASPDADLSQTDAQILITANDYSEISLLPPVLRRLNEVAPRVTTILRSIEAVSLDSPDFIEGKVHFAVAGTVAPPGPFETRPLFEEHFVVIAREGHPDIGPGLLMEDYLGASHALVSPQGHGLKGPIDDYLETLGRRRHIALSVTRFTSLPYLLSSTDLIATVPSRFAGLAEVRRSCQVIDLPFRSPVFVMSLIWHRRFRNDPLHAWLRELIAAQLT